MAIKRPGCVVALIILLVCGGLFFVALLAGLGSSGAKGSAPAFQEVDVEPGTAGKIAVLDLNGVISAAEQGDLGETMVDDLKIAMRQAAKDHEVKAVVLRIDSPGGEVTASDIIYHELKKLREIKPVVVHISSVGASGGYYVACGSSYVMSTDTSITGSIGVIIHTLNYRELLGKVGLESVVFKSGKFKDMLSGSREMTVEEQEYVQGLVMQTYTKFVGIVAGERKLDEQTLRNGVADGRVLSGSDALAAGLVDATGYVEDAYAKARELGGAPDASVVRYSAPMKLGRLLKMLAESTAPRIELLPGKQMSLQPGRLYLLPSFMAP